MYEYIANDFRVDQVRHQLALETLLRLVHWILSYNHEILPGYFYGYSPVIVTLI